MEKVKIIKINLKDFRGKLIQLKNSLAEGQVYQIIDKGTPIAYFVPSEYEIKIERKHNPKIQKEIYEALMKIKGRAEFKDEVKDAKDYKEAYRRLLEMKYLKK